jgi:hypothetical protein
VNFDGNAKIFRFFSYFIPVIIGAAAFFLVVGPRAINVTNIAWLAKGDPATHFLGWDFFRHTNWSFPLGLNPRYGLELGNAIVFSDSNPLFALIFKPFSRLLPEPFQYFGIWLLVCFILQAWFGWKLTGLISNNVAILGLAASLFVFSPPMIFRVYGHLSLAAHFLILASLYFTFNEELKSRTTAWCVLLLTAVLIHAYLFIMVAPLWVTDLFWKTLKKRLAFRKSASEFFIITIAVCFTCWQVGYFTPSAGMISVGFGYHRMNLLSIFDADNWSYFLKDIPTSSGEGEGFNFLGSGIIFLVILALPSLVSGRAHFISFVRRFPHLLLLLSAFTLFALSNKIGVASFIYEISISDHVLAAVNIFRSSGRMFWPVFYVLIFYVIFLVVRSSNERTAVIILILALTIQIVDTKPGWSGIRHNSMTVPSKVWSTPLINAFWSEAGSKYTKIRWIQPAFETPHWLTLSAYASRHGMATDAVYLARVSQEALENAKQRSFEELYSGKYENDSIYVLDDRSFQKAALSIDGDNDLLAQIDGFNVVAPGWKNCAACHQVENEINIKSLLLPVAFGQRMLFTNSGSSETYLGAGWSSPEAWGTWSENSSALIVLPLQANEANTLTIEAKPWLNEHHQKQDVFLAINGVNAGKINFDKNTENLVLIKIPDEVKKVGVGDLLRLKFYFPDAVRPIDIGVSPERRKLGLGLVAITVR